MLVLTSELNNILQALIAVILIGVFYSLWATTKAYGGLIGHAVRFIGIGITFISAVVLEKMLINFGVVTNSVNMQITQDVLTLGALIFLAIGFKRLAAAAKTP